MKFLLYRKSKEFELTFCLIILCIICLKVNADKNKIMVLGWKEEWVCEAIMSGTRFVVKCLDFVE